MIRDGEHAVEVDGDNVGDPSGAAAETTWNSSRVSIATLNTDGLGKYKTPPCQRMHKMLDALLARKPDIILLQEVTHPMYAVVKRRLTN